MHNVTCRGLTLSLGDGTLTAFLNGIPLLPSPQPLWVLHAHDGREYASTGFAESVCAEDGILHLDHFCSIYHFSVRILPAKDEIRLSIFGHADWPEEAPQPVKMSLPWLSSISLENAAVRFPGAPLSKSDGGTALQHKGMLYPPYCMEQAGGTGIAFFFPLEAAGLKWDACRNQELCAVSSEKDLTGLRLHLRLTAWDNCLVDMRIFPLENGWTECFRRTKDLFRTDLDLSMQARPDLDWIHDCTLVHFTYAFGHEFLDPDTHDPDPDHLLDEGECFGGYDAVILWHEYPRLGVDERTQWDLFDDYPGGIDHLRRITARAHSRGTRVIIPFKPWDRSPRENDEQTALRIARLIEAIDADGIFFDTMDTVPPSLRRAVDRVKPGVVFMVESEPVSVPSIEQISCSWNQYHTDPPMPESNLLRFLVPEQQRFAVARWHTGYQKDLAIERAVFNGEGMVIWQDVFGCWLPYTGSQKEKVRAWKRLHRQYGALFNSSDSIPLLTTCRRRLFANGFYLDDEAVITLYNDSPDEISGRLLSAAGYDLAAEVRLGMPAGIVSGSLHGVVPPRTTAVVHLKRR